MRVLFWSDLFWPYIGGAEIVAAQLLPALTERGYDFLVVTSHGYFDLPDEARYRGVPVYRFPFRMALAAGNLDQFAETRRRLAALTRAFAPELIHINGLGPSLLFHLGTADSHAAPLLVTLHSARPKTAAGQDTLFSRILGAADWITCVSRATLRETRQLAPTISPHSSLIHNALEVPPVSPRPLPIESPRLLCLGRLVHNKGFDVALTALALIVDRLPNVHLVIAGDGPEWPALEQQAAELGLSKVVTFIGSVPPDGVPELINSATVVVIPSRREGFGLVALEAALMARPVVASRVGGLPEVVMDQRTGLLIEQDDSDGLAAAISLLLEDPGVAARMGQAARRHAQEMFGFKRCVNAFDALYQRLIREAPCVGVR